jgi:hypothetical protein
MSALHAFAIITGGAVGWRITADAIWLYDHALRRRKRGTR